MTPALVAAISIAFAGAATPSPSPPLPSPSASPAGRHSLTLAIPQGWVRTESGPYNEWRSPDGLANFRVSVMPSTPQYHGPAALEAVKASFQPIAERFNKNAQITVKTVQACNGEQQAYRIDDPLGMGSAGFMEVIPGSDSSGLINYEIKPGGKQDPAILTAIDKICWP